MNKKAVFEMMWKDRPLFFVRVTAGKCVMPPGFTGPWPLAFGADLTPPITDLLMDENGLSAVLSYNNAPFHTIIPWAAVFAIHDSTGYGRMWPEDAPSSVRADMRRASFRVIQGGRGSGPEAA